MASSSAIRGSRIGGGTARPAERGEPAPRQEISYWCANAHHILVPLVVGVPVPALWECPRCGLPAGRDPDNPPGAPRTDPYKSHLAYVKERRSEADGAALLAEALAALRQRRGEP